MGVKRTPEQFIKDAIAVHGNKYIYSETYYINFKTKVNIICPIHGMFSQLPGHHLQGQGCPHCAGNIRYTTEQWIEKAINVHGDKYDYSESEYVNSQTMIGIICPYHGIFYQKPYSHLLGHGCAACSLEEQSYTNETFADKANEIHNFKYDYSEVNYVNHYTEVVIICPEHGRFRQRPDVHLRGYGCSLCSRGKNTSKGEKEVLEFIKSIYSGEVLENTRDFIGKKELDIYIPELKFAIEYNGDYWHKLKEQRIPGYHENKRNICEEQGIKLIEILDTQWKKNKESIKENILSEIKKLSH